MSVTTGGVRAFQRWSDRMTGPELADWHRKAHREIHLQVVSEMIKGTPVGNPKLWLSMRPYQSLSKPGKTMIQRKPPQGYVGGRARSNWQSSVLVPKAGEPNGPNAERYPGRGETELLNRQGIADLRPYSRSFVTNNTPYIVVLNDGLNGRQHSYQAPLQWMETALDRVGAQFNRGGV